MISNNENRLFLTPKKLTREFSLLPDARGFSSKTRHLKDILIPTFSQHFDEFHGSDVTLIGQKDTAISLVDQYSDGHVTRIYDFEFDNEFQKSDVIEIDNIDGLKSFDNKILLPDRTHCVLFSRNGFAVHINVMRITNGRGCLNEGTLVLDECQHSPDSPVKICMSLDTDLVAIIQSYVGNSRTAYSYLTIDLIQVILTPGHTVKIKFITRTRMEIYKTNKVLDCQFVCNGEKLIIITDSPSEGNVFMCFSVAPFQKLYSTKITCERLGSNGWFFYNHSETGNQMLLTYKHHMLHIDTFFEVFSLIDDRNFIPKKKFKLSDFGIWSKLPWHYKQKQIKYPYCVNFVANHLFITNEFTSYMFDIDKECLIYSFHFPEVDGRDLFRTVDIWYNSQEIFMWRKFMIVPHVNENGEYITDMESDYYLNVYRAPIPEITFFGLCRDYVCSLCSTDEEIGQLPLPKRLKNELMGFKEHYNPTSIPPEPSQNDDDGLEGRRSRLYPLPR